MAQSPQIPAPDAREERIGQVLNDFLDRRARGDPASRASLLAQHPDLADDLRAHLDLLRDLQPGGGRIEDLIRQGILTHSADPRYVAEFGPYRILGLIGRGGMGIVLKACEENLDRLVALKVLRPELADDVTVLARFEREAKAAATLRHPNVVTVYAVGQQLGVPFIAMEYVDGISLAQALRTDGLPSTNAVRRIMRELLTGLDAAHKAGLIHRDIKPSNILLDLRSEEGSREQGIEGSRSETTAHLDPLIPCSLDPFVKIADFGLARVHTAHTQLTLTECALGTPAYMSPEQAQGAKDIDHRTDLYSVGVVLYEMLTGQTPFGADASAATIHRILTQEPPDPQRLLESADPHLTSLALRLMAKRPEDRLATAGATIAALDAAQHVHSLEQRRRGRQRLQRIALPVVLLALLLAIWLPLARRGSSSPALPQRIHEVRADPDTPRAILARYDDDATWRVFRNDFPNEVTSLGAVRLAHLGADGQEAVVAALNIPHAAANLVAFDAGSRRELWSVSMCQPWPGADPGEPWHVTCVETADLGAGRGEELLVVANATRSFPSRLSVIDPKTGTIRSTFWHMGHLGQPRIAPDFLGPGRPAVVATCLANKLDEFPVTAGEKPRTTFDLVPALLVLDPNAMDGLGPPLVVNVPDLPRVQPYAYAFLNLPPSEQGTYVPAGESRRVTPPAEMCAHITELLIPSQVPSATATPHLIVGISRSTGGGATLTLDRDLTPLRAVVSSGETEGASSTYWLEHWIPVFQDGQPLPPRATAAPLVDTGAGAAPDTPAAATAPASLTAVWIDKHKPTVILARRGIDDPPAIFHQFPAAAGSVACVGLVDSDGHGPSMVVAGLGKPYEDHAIFAYDLEGKELARLDLSSDRQWPDCAPPTKWKCPELLAANLDGEPGDELIAVVQDCYEYPTRVSLIDPRTWAVRSTFWHIGVIGGLTLIPDFFESGHPALAIVGLNNKLDGFAEPAAGDEPPRTRYDLVSVAMILDPRDMDGIGPPRTERLADLPLARPYAYAFLDLPPRPNVSYISPEDGARMVAQPGETVSVHCLTPAPYASSDDTGPWSLLYLERSGGLPVPGYLIVDRHLAARRFVVPSGATTDADFEYWRRYWHPIIKQGRYIKE